MKRRLILICIAVLLLAGVWTPAGVAADADHPIVMTILCDPDPELEIGGTIPDLLFTIRNTGKTDYTLEHATLSGGFEDRTLILDESITVLAGGTKEFHLTDVPVDDAQLDTNVIYRLSWKESELLIDNEEGTTTTIEHERETEAEIRIERFVPPELAVEAAASAERVRAGETFTVTYTITNDTKFDMSGLKLYDPEQSMQSIGLPSAELFAGESRSVEVTYTMGNQDMTFAPVIEYTVRQREQTTRAADPLVVESVVVDLVIEVEQYPTTSDGSTFAITVRNNGNRAVTNIRVYDEINTEVDEPFDLAPEQSKVLMYTVPSAISAGTIRKIRFHLTAVDAFETEFTVTDANLYEAVPFINSDSVMLVLNVVLQRAFYNEDGKLCAVLQFEIRNYSKITLHDATLTELQLFDVLKTYDELQHGETYFVTTLQLDGVPELSFRVDAFDPSGALRSTETVRLDLSRLKELANQTDDPVYVYPAHRGADRADSCGDLRGRVHHSVHRRTHDSRKAARRVRGEHGERDAEDQAPRRTADLRRRADRAVRLYRADQAAQLRRADRAGGGGAPQGIQGKAQREPARIPFVARGDQFKVPSCRAARIERRRVCRNEGHAGRTVQTGAGSRGYPVDPRSAGGARARKGSGQARVETAEAGFKGTGKARAKTACETGDDAKTCQTGRKTGGKARRTKAGPDARAKTGSGTNARAGRAAA